MARGAAGGARWYSRAMSDGIAALDVAVIDYGAGNLRSVVRAVERAGGTPAVATGGAALESADAVILPGVGAAADTMRNLRERGLVEPIREYVRAERPFLGVCMGLQALMTVSYEGGEHACLDLVPGRVVRLPEGRKIPHMGWNRVRARSAGNGGGALLRGIPEGAHFYFVHSYYCEVEDAEDVAAVADYGCEVTAVVERGSLAATQFHPEKSGAYGLRIYRNFLAAAACRG